MRKLPVVPLCRRPAVLLETPNQRHLLRVPLPQEGRFAIVTDVGSGMRWTLMARETNALDADGEGVWSWPPHAEAKVARSSRGRWGQESPVPRESAQQAVKPLRGECRMYPVPPL